ncbi:MAG: 2Fe-2S iron-sulfur cluster-binding protein [Rhodomicrobium sp.]|jgi:2Fe-2S ferredoxin
MPTITVLPSGAAVDASEGDTILFALLVGGVPIKTECTGRAQCSSCHILVHEGAANLSQIAGPESDRFKEIPSAGPKSRLACQAVVGTGDATIEVVDLVLRAEEERNV